MSEALGFVAFMGLIALIGWAQEWRRRQRLAQHQPPPVERVDPRDLCAVLECHRKAEVSVAGWLLCDQHSPV